MEKKLNIEFKSNSSNSYNLQTFTPKTEKGENKRATERSSENRNSIK